MRKLYLDNIRWATVILVVIYHVFYMFNAAGVLGGIGAFQKVQYQDAILYFVYPWFMVLLFLISGICTRYSLNKKTNKEFIKNRTRTLLVPSTLGLLLFQWIVGYYNVKVGGGLDQIPGPAIYPISVLSGTGPLWFAQVLWVFSLLIILVKKLDKNDKLYLLCKKVNTPVIILFGILIWGGAQILNAPVITTYRFGIYFVAYLLGFFVFSHDEVQERVQKIHFPMLLIALITGIVYTYFYFESNYASDAVLKSVFTNAYAWIMVLAILGCGKAWFDKQGKFAVYMTKANFGFYALHYMWVLIPGYCLRKYTSCPCGLIYVLLIVIALIGTAVTYELFKRIPFVRYIVLGMKGKKTKTTKK